jgi:hypothetical protein
MFDLTQNAGAQLHRALAAASMPDNEGKCFRVVPKDEKLLTLKIAKPAPSDSTYQYDGMMVLALPKALRPFFEGKRLDIDATGNLKLRPH